MSLNITNSSAQFKTIVVFDLVNESMDSITNISYDSTIQQEKTSYYTGAFDEQVEILEQTEPVANVFPNTQFTTKRKAALDYNVNHKRPK